MCHFLDRGAVKKTIYNKKYITIYNSKNQSTSHKFNIQPFIISQKY